MKKLNNRIHLFTFFISVTLIGNFFTQVNAQELPNVNRKLKIAVSLLGGIETEDIDIGETTDGESCSISGGGGVGTSIALGFGFNSKIDIEVEAGIKNKSLSPSVKNVDGNFDRSFMLATVKYKKPIGKNGQLKAGFGVGYHQPGDLDIDSNKLPRGNHVIVRYDDAVGFQITGEYERFYSGQWAGVFGIKYEHITYDAKSSKIDGVPGTIDILTDEARELKGNGFDLMFSIARYF